MNQTALAKALGVSQQAVNAWLKGRALPEPERMAQIEELLSIPMRDWVVPSDNDSVPELGSDADESGPHARVDADSGTGTEG